MKAYQLFGKTFTKQYLKSIFEEKISLSPAVGTDGVRMTKFEDVLDKEITIILRKAHSSTYSFSPYKQKLVSKGPENPPRQISIPTIRDRITLRALNDLLTDVFPKARTPLPQSLVKKIKRSVANLDESYCFLRMDVKEFYPSINHDIILKFLKRKIRKKQILHLIVDALKTPTGSKKTEANTNGAGVPQGLSISNVLACIYLETLDDKLSKTFDYHRYVDDILVICKKTDANELYENVRAQLDQYGLSAHPLKKSNKHKTTIASLNERVDYLGYSVGQQMVSVKTSSYRRMFNNISKVFTQYKYGKNKEKFLLRLNLKISGCIADGKRYGWMFYFSQTEDKSQLKYLDVFVLRLLNQYGLVDQIQHTKRFIRAFHEIRYNSTDTSYIPHFDTFSYERKIAFLSTMTGKTIVEIETWEIQRIDRQFWREVKQQVSELERDVFVPNS